MIICDIYKFHKFCRILQFMLWSFDLWSILPFPILSKILILTTMVETFSLITKISISICLVRAWRTWLWAIATALWLSQKIMGMLKETFNSFIRVSIQDIFVVVWAKLWYSAFVLDLATTCCFWDRHDMRLGPKWIVEPKVDLLSSISEAQFASHKALKGYGCPKTAGLRL